MSYHKTLCPVCENNFMLENFKTHILDEHQDFCKLTKVDDKLFEILEQSTNLKNVVNNVYYNWDYHIQTKYELTPQDKHNYRIAIVSLRQGNKPESNKNILERLIKLDDKFKINRLGANVVRSLIDGALFG